MGASFAAFKTARRPTKSFQFMKILPQSKRRLVLSSVLPSKTEAICSTKWITKTLRITKSICKKTTKFNTNDSQFFTAFKRMTN